MIDVINVTKAYKSNINVVNDVSFTVSPGEMLGLLGPNGAGKTTLMQMVSTLLKPSSGRILISGLDTATDDLEIKKHMGFLTTEVKLDPDSTPNRLFDYFSRLYQIDKKTAAMRKTESFERFGILPFADKKISQLSTGMRQKISISISLIHNPEVVIFDEPTNGLDILSSHQVQSYLKFLRDTDHTVLLSTHIFSVAESLCDRIAIIIDGKIVATGRTDELIRMTDTSSFEDAFLKLYSMHHHEAAPAKE
ncbi:MAG: ABC transporter ATP-binding protein [Clostridiaceae bacterium]|nr:ABC transporter ATP-binding protein [Clostridiaceae bacterium]